MRLQKIARWTAMSTVLSLSAVAGAQTPKAHDAKKPGDTTLVDSRASKLSDTDLQVLAHVHQSDMLEVKAGKLAMDKATDQGVKSFGKTLVDDHSADAQMILSLVQKQGLTLPDVKPMSEADKADMQLAQDTMAKLESLSGKDFNVEFLRAQIAMHDKTLAKLDLMISQIKDNADLVQSLRNTRPVIVKHKQHAQMLLGASHPKS